VFPSEVWQGIPIGKSTEALHRLRETDRPAFLTGYMCQPPSAEGDLFQHFTEDAPPLNVQRCIQFWDTTTTEKTGSDFNAMVEFHKASNGRSFVAKALNFKKRPTDTIEIMLREYWRAEEEGLNPLIVIERAHAGPMFVEWLQKYSGVRVRDHLWGGFGKGNSEKKRGPKDLYSRAVAAVNHVEGGIVYFPRGCLEGRQDGPAQNIKRRSARAASELPLPRQFTRRHGIGARRRDRVSVPDP
jgi:phage terminase large subunit-like protein